MANVIVAIMRHAEYEQPSGVPSAHLPHPLTATGREQARAVAGELRAKAEAEGWAIDSAVHTSVSLRAWETGKLVADSLGEGLGRSFEVHSFEALCERCVGAAANLTVAQIEEVIAKDPRYPPLPPGWKSRSDFQLPLPGAESLLTAGAKVAAHLRASLSTLASRVERDTLRLVVGHGASLRHAAYHLGLLPDLGAVRARSMFHCRPIFFAWKPDEPWDQIAGDWKHRHRPEQPD